MDALVRVIEDFHYVYFRNVKTRRHTEPSHDAKRSRHLIWYIYQMRCYVSTRGSPTSNRGKLGGAGCGLGGVVVFFFLKKKKRSFSFPPGGSQKKKGEKGGVAVCVWGVGVVIYPPPHRSS